MTISSDEIVDILNSVRADLAQMRERCVGCITPAEHAEALAEMLAALKAAASSAGFQYMLAETRDQIDAAIAKAGGQLEPHKFIKRPDGTYERR